MRRHAGFWWRALKHSVAWYKGALDHFGRLLVILGFFGVPTAVIAVTNQPWWTYGLLAATLVIVGLGAGVYAEWDETDRHAIELQAQMVASPKAQPIPSQALHNHQEFIRSLARRFGAVGFPGSIDVSAETNYLQQHIPESPLWKQAKSWNQTAAKYNEARQRLADRAHIMSRTIDVTFPQTVETMLNGQVESLITLGIDYPWSAPWGIHGGNIVGRGLGVPVHSVADVPGESREEQADLIRIQVETLLKQIAIDPDVRESKRLFSQAQSLARTMAEISGKITGRVALPGECELCCQ